MVAVDVVEKKLDLARAFGATSTVNAAHVEDVPRAVRSATEGGAEVALEVIGRQETIRQAFDALRWGGRLVVVGYPEGDVTLNGAKLMFREMEVRGSLGCGLQDFPALIDLAGRGLLPVREMVSHRFPLEDIGEGFDLLEKGDSALLRSIATP